MPWKPSGMTYSRDPARRDGLLYARFVELCTLVKADLDADRPQVSTDVGLVHHSNRYLSGPDAGQVL
jgi:hypothetical protein